jgi:DNA-binding NtrC family response regulator
MNPDGRNSRKRVLLIDDDESIAGSLFQYLSTQGCDVDVAVDATSAGQLMDTRQYAVIVVDPYLTGGVLSEDSSLIGSISLLQPRGAMIVLTGYDSPSLHDAATANDAAAVLSKPQPVTFLSQLIVDAMVPRTDESSSAPRSTKG